MGTNNFSGRFQTGRGGTNQRTRLSGRGGFKTSGCQHAFPLWYEEEVRKACRPGRS